MTSVDSLLNTLCGAIRAALDTPVSIYLYGSLVLGDYRPGWSDIDLLCLTAAPLTVAQAACLLNLRQTLVQQSGDPRFRAAEGHILSQTGFQFDAPERVVYWGTSGERITDSCHLDSFTRWQLYHCARRLAGDNCLGWLTPPTAAELRQDVLRHYESIRTHAVVTSGNLYACGWLLDIARCLYTLRTGRVTGKTQAGTWALETGMCNVSDALRRALAIRRDPLKYRDTPAYQTWAANLGPTVQAYANLLEAELAHRSEPGA